MASDKRKKSRGHSASERESVPVQHQSSPASRWKIAIYILVFVLAIYTGMRVWNWFELEQEMKQMQQEEQQLIEEREQLEKDKEKYNDPQQIEKEAREQLGLVKENEIPYIR